VLELHLRVTQLPFHLVRFLDHPMPRIKRIVESQRLIVVQDLDDLADTDEFLHEKQIQLNRRI